MTGGKFTPEQAAIIAAAFARHRVRYLFIGKSGAILLGYPSTTQDVDLFLPKGDRENARAALAALEDAGFALGEDVRQAVLETRDFVQITQGPFDVDLVHAPDGIESFEEANARAVDVEGLPVANIRDIIASKRASGRRKDIMDLDLLENFKKYWEAANPAPLPTSRQAAERRVPRSEPKEFDPPGNP